jgi:hypothetical protein
MWLLTEGLLVAYQERWTPSATQSWSTTLIPASGWSWTTTGCHRCFHPWCSAGAYMRKFGYSSHKTEQRIVTETDARKPIGDGADRASHSLLSHPVSGLQLGSFSPTTASSWMNASSCSSNTHFIFSGSWATWH